MKCEFHHQVCVTNEPLFLYWISYCLHLPWTLWTITIAHTLTAMARSTMRSLSVTTAYSFIADRHIPQDWMCVSSSASRCHWFVRVWSLGHNWSLQPGSPCVFDLWRQNTAGDSISDAGDGQIKGWRPWCLERSVTKSIAAMWPNHKYNVTWRSTAELFLWSLANIKIIRMEDRLWSVSNACQSAQAYNYSDKFQFV